MSANEPCDSESDEYSESDVTETKGDFYHAYKQEMIGCLKFIEDQGVASVDSELPSEADRALLRRRIHTIQTKGADLPKLLGMIFDENAPSFYQECTIEAFWTVIEAAFTIGQCAGITNPQVHAYQAKEKTRISLGAKETKDRNIKAARLDVLRTYVASRSINAYTKFVQSNLDDINAAAREAGAVPAGKSTWIGLMGDLGFGPTKNPRLTVLEQKSKTDSDGTI